MSHLCHEVLDISRALVNRDKHRVVELSSTSSATTVQHMKANNQAASQSIFLV